VNLEHATALVTGANRGIGLALTQRLSREPLRAILAGVRDVAKLKLEPTTSHVHPVRMDLSSRAEIDACCDELGDDLTRIDLLINNAGLVTGGLLEEQDMEQVYAMFQVNLTAVAHLTHRVLPGMLARRRGTIVNNASISGYAHFPAATTYAASKAGVVALTESLRRELQGTGVHAMHLVTPGVQTDMLSTTEDIYSRYLDISGWGKISPERWADQVVEAIKQDKHILKPRGKERLALIASSGPQWLLDRTTRRVFSRTPRR
jgi:uncharacterized protein